MRIKHLIPVILFCFIFLVYSIYFIKVINSRVRIEKNSIAESLKRIRKEQPKIEKQAVIQEVQKQELPSTIEDIIPVETLYVNFTWLNVRKEPTLLSPVLEKILLNDEVSVFSYPKPGWAYVQTPSGIRGYVSKKYLSKQVINQQPETRNQKLVTSNQQVSYQIPIITYYHISNDTQKYSPNLNLPLPNFFAQLDYLIANQIETLTFYDLEKIKNGDMRLPEKAVILTFDDGYSDAYQAAQHLNGKGLKGVFFVITEKVGSSGYLTWDQLKKMHSWGMEIGSHTKNHPDLVGSSLNDVKKELAESKKILEEKLEASIISFAYPASNYNNSVVQEVKNAGYLFAKTEIPGKQYKEKNFLKLPTLRVFSPAGAKQFKVWLK